MNQVVRKVIREYVCVLSRLIPVQQSVLGLDLPVTCNPWEFFSLLFIIVSFIEIANGKVKLADMRKIFSLQKLGILDFKTIWTLLCIILYWRIKLGEEYAFEDVLFIVVSKFFVSFITNEYRRIGNNLEEHAYL